MVKAEGRDDVWIKRERNALFFIIAGRNKGKNRILLI